MDIVEKLKTENMLAKLSDYIEKLDLFLSDYRKEYEDISFSLEGKEMYNEVVTNIQDGIAALNKTVSLLKK